MSPDTPNPSNRAAHVAVGRHFGREGSPFFLFFVFVFLFFSYAALSYNDYARSDWNLSQVFTFVLDGASFAFPLYFYPSNGTCIS